MTGPLADLAVDWAGGVALVAVNGEIDLSNGASLERRLRTECAPATAVVLDLSGVAYMDSAGLALVDGLARDLAGRGAGLRLVAPPGSAPQRVIALAGLDVPLDPTRDAAVAGLAPDA
ncbi:MAG: STAS domain-containing protein [Actinomycetota bacterium]